MSVLRGRLCEEKGNNNMSRIKAVNLMFSLEVNKRICFYVTKHVGNILGSLHKTKNLLTNYKGLYCLERFCEKEVFNFLVRDSELLYIPHCNA
jgi:hypothetical protein